MFKIKRVVSLLVLSMIGIMGIISGCSGSGYREFEVKADYEVSEIQKKKVEEKKDSIVSFLDKLVKAETNEEVDNALSIVKPYLSEEAYLNCLNISYEAKSAGQIGCNKNIENVKVTYEVNDKDNTESYQIQFEYDEKLIYVTMQGLKNKTLSDISTMEVKG